MSNQKETVHQGKWLKMVKEGHWEYVERVNATGVVIIIPVTDDGKLVLVEQYRIPMHCNCIELPAGLAGDKTKETDEEAVRRELAEETGYEAGQIVNLGFGVSSPGLTSENAAMFLATGLMKLDNPPKDSAEQITLHEIPVDLVPQWLEEKRKANLAIDWKVYAALYFCK